MAKKTGRPKIEVDFKTVDNLIAIQCTGEEIASVLGINYDTLNTRVKENFGLSFSDYFTLKSGNGKASLRRMQWKLAESGNPTMLIWLGKNYLSQADKQEVTHDGEVTTTINFVPASSLKKKAKDE